MHVTSFVAGGIFHDGAKRSRNWRILNDGLGLLIGQSGGCLLFVATVYRIQPVVQNGANAAFQTRASILAYDTADTRFTGGIDFQGSADLIA